MAIPTLVIGDTFAHPGTFYSGEPSAPYSIVGAQVTAAIVTPDHAIKMCDDTLQVIINETDAANGRITVSIPASITQQLGAFIDNRGAGLVELQITQGTAKYSWFSPVDIVRGHIA